MVRTRGSGGPQGSSRYHNPLPEPNFLRVARVPRAWGIRDELTIKPFTDRPEDLTRLEHVYIGPEHRRYTVTRFRPYQGNWLLHVEGVETRDAAELLHGQWIAVDLEARRLLAEGEFFAHQVIGLRVQKSEGEELGTVSEILATGANDVYVVRGERGEILLPARVEVIQSIDPAAGLMIVKLLPGLIE